MCQSYVMRKVAYLCRIPRTIGFGVQSPTDYRFLHEVINADSDICPYGDMKLISADLSHSEHRLGNLWARLLLSSQIRSVYHDETFNTIFTHYLFKTGCECRITSLTQLSSDPYNPSLETSLCTLIEKNREELDNKVSVKDSKRFIVATELWCIDASLLEYDIWNHIWLEACNPLILFVRNIRYNHKMHHRWKMWSYKRPQTVVFDLYDDAIVFLNVERYHQYYRVNLR